MVIIFVAKGTKFSIYEDGVEARSVDTSRDIRITPFNEDLIQLIENEEPFYEFQWFDVSGSFGTREEVIDYLLSSFFVTQSEVTISGINGAKSGTLFGDDIRTTRRIPVVSSTWSTGLPTFAIDLNFWDAGRWYIESDGLYTDGVSTLETGTASTGGVLASTTRLNRYQAGQLSYFQFTAAFEGIDTSNNDFTMLCGALQRGLASDGEFGLIKEGYLFGYVKESGELKYVFRTYKNFTYTQEIITEDLTYVKDNLNIFRLEVGYLGIHPALLYRVDVPNLTNKLVHKYSYNMNGTSVANPNLALGVYVKNEGNTTNLKFKNGSMQFGNYAERESPDPSASATIFEFPTL